MKKIALIGVGKMGISHLAIANSLPDVEVVAICDTSAPLMKAMGKNTKFKTFTNYKKMLEEVSLDAVMILVPNTLHFEITAYCIEKGLHVFVEKPFTTSYNESKQLVALAQKNHLKGQVGYVNRFNPVFRRVKKLLSDEAIGSVVSYHNSMKGAVIVKPSNKGWRNDYAKGGGCLNDYGPHCLDLATYFFGTEVEVVAASLKKVFSTAVDDIVSTILIHNNAVIGYNYINWSDASVRKATNTIEIFGTKGKIIANKQEITLFLNEAHPTLNLDKGWHQFYITDENTEVPYYLRGEDFTMQLMEFSNLINNKITTSSSDLFSASITDKIIEEIKLLNSTLL